MTTIVEYMQMGGYGVYIWPSYGVTALIMIVMLVVSQRTLRSNEATYKRLAADNQQDNKDGTVEKKT